MARSTLSTSSSPAGAVLVSALIFALAAASPAAASGFATVVQDYWPNADAAGDALPATQLDPTAALGPQDGVSVSLGHGGVILLGFAHAVGAADGPDLVLHEATTGADAGEAAEVWVSTDGALWYPVAPVTGGYELPAAVPAACFVSVADLSQGLSGDGAAANGLDVDALEGPAPTGTPCGPRLYSCAEGEERFLAHNAVGGASGGVALTIPDFFCDGETALFVLEDGATFHIRADGSAELDGTATVTEGGCGHESELWEVGLPLEPGETTTDARTFVLLEDTAVLWEVGHSGAAVLAPLSHGTFVLGHDDVTGGFSFHHYTAEGGERDGEGSYGFSLEPTCAGHQDHEPPVCATSEVIYLADNKASDNQATPGHHPACSSLYTVEVTDAGRAEVTPVYVTHDEDCAGSLPVAGPHIAASPDGGRVYVIDNRSGLLGYVDAASGVWTEVGIVEVAGLAPGCHALGAGKGFVQLAFNAEGRLFAASQRTDEVYELDPATADAVSLGPVKQGQRQVNIGGGDLTFAPDGTPFLLTNQGAQKHTKKKAGHGLYTLDFGDYDGSVSGQRVTSVKQKISGLAFLADGTLLASIRKAGGGKIAVVDPATGDRIATWPLYRGEDKLAHVGGDLAVAKVEVCAD